MRRRVRSVILHTAFHLFSWPISHLNLATAQRFGRFLGRIVIPFVTRDRRKAHDSIEIAFPDKDVEEREELIRQTFRHLGTSLGELLWMPRLDRDELARTTEWRGLEHLDRAVAAGRGVVLFTGHCGNWEWMAAAIALAGYEMNVIAREIDDSRVNEIIVASRARFGVATIGRGGDTAARDILRTLRTGKILGVLIDQSIRAEVVPCEFFGKPAPTPVGPARLAIRAEAMAIAGFIQRRADGSHLVEFHPGVDSRDLDAAELTCEMNRLIEQQIRRVPEQWVWIHQRWRTREGQRAHESRR